MLFILRAGPASGGKASNKSNRKANKNLKPLWNPSKLVEGDYFSSISYMKVNKIEGDTITVTNSLGGSWMMSKALLLRDAWSADHFTQEVKTNMTNMAEILTLCRDTIFKVSFKKKVDVKDVQSALEKANLKNDK